MKNGFYFEKNGFCPLQNSMSKRKTVNHETRLFWLIFLPSACS